MKILADLQSWFLSQCDDDWEHSSGIKIETLDNPGWTITINLTGTELSGKPYTVHEYGLDKEDHNWLHCEVKDDKFFAAGGPEKLEEMITVFLNWTRQSG
jgi:hypothetical protein